MSVETLLGMAKGLMDSLGLTNVVLAFGVIALVAAVINYFFGRR